MKNLGKSLAILVSLFSFFTFSNANSKNIIFNISDKKVDCTGIVPQKCLVVNGKYFYDNIKGFNYEEGYNYKIEVKKELACDINKLNNCPQDISIYKYSLVKILEKKSTKIKIHPKTKEILDNTIKKVINKIEEKYKDNKKREEIINSIIDRLNEYSVKNPKLEYIIYYINNELLKQLSKYSGGPIIQY